MLRRPLGIQGASSDLSLSETETFLAHAPSHDICLQTALDPRCKAAVCYFATDIHSASLSPTGDDSLERASKGEIRGEVVMIFGTQDGHVVSLLAWIGRGFAREKLGRALTSFPLVFLGIDSRSRAGTRSGTH